MSARREVCRRKEITLSQQKVGESPRMEKSRREGCVMGREGKHLERAAAKLGQSSVAAGTHRPRPAGHVVLVSQPRVSQAESS